MRSPPDLDSVDESSSTLPMEGKNQSYSEADDNSYSFPNFSAKKGSAEYDHAAVMLNSEEDFLESPPSKSSHSAAPSVDSIDVAFNFGTTSSLDASAISEDASFTPKASKNAKNTRALYTPSATPSLDKKKGDKNSLNTFSIQPTPLFAFREPDFSQFDEDEKSPSGLSRVSSTLSSISRENSNSMPQFTPVDLDLGSMEVANDLEMYAVAKAQLKNYFPVDTPEKEKEKDKPALALQYSFTQAPDGDLDTSFQDDKNDNEENEGSAKKENDEEGDSFDDRLRKAETEEAPKKKPKAYDKDKSSQEKQTRKAEKAKEKKEDIKSKIAPDGSLDDMINDMLKDSEGKAKSVSDEEKEEKEEKKEAPNPRKGIQKIVKGQEDKKEELKKPAATEPPVFSKSGSVEHVEGSLSDDISFNFNISNEDEKPAAKTDKEATTKEKDVTKADKPAIKSILKKPTDKKDKIEEDIDNSEENTKDAKSKAKLEKMLVPLNPTPDFGNFLTDPPVKKYKKNADNRKLVAKSAEEERESEKKAKKEKAVDDEEKDNEKQKLKEKEEKEKQKEKEEKEKAKQRAKEKEEKENAKEKERKEKEEKEKRERKEKQKKEKERLEKEEREREREEERERQKARSKEKGKAKADDDDIDDSDDDRELTVNRKRKLPFSELERKGRKKTEPRKDEFDVPEDNPGWTKKKRSRGEDSEPEKEKKGSVSRISRSRSNENSPSKSTREKAERREKKVKPKKEESESEEETASGRRSLRTSNKRKRILVEGTQDESDWITDFQEDDDDESSTPKKTKKARKIDFDDGEPSSSSSGKKSSEDSNSNKPKKPKPLFKGISFVLTGLSKNDEDPHSEQKLKVLIKARGGAFLDILQFQNPNRSPTSKKKNAIPKLILISDQHRQTLKYITAVASGTPCLHYQWLLDSCESDKLISLEKHRLPSGTLIESGKSVYLDSAAYDVFRGLRVELIGASDFKEGWSKVMRMTGAKVVQRLFSADESRVECVVSDPVPDELILKRTDQLCVPVMSVTWVIQSIMMKRSAPYDGHPTFYTFHTDSDA